MRDSYITELLCQGSAARTDPRISVLRVCHSPNAGLSRMCLPVSVLTSSSLSAPTWEPLTVPSGLACWLGHSSVALLSPSCVLGTACFAVLSLFHCPSNRKAPRIPIVCVVLCQWRSCSWLYAGLAWCRDMRLGSRGSTLGCYSSVRTFWSKNMNLSMCMSYNKRPDLGSQARGLRDSGLE